jgi:hypothetical protein
MTNDFDLAVDQSTGKPSAATLCSRAIALVLIVLIGLALVVVGPLLRFHQNEFVNLPNMPLSSQGGKVALVLPSGAFKAIGRLVCAVT